MDTNNNTLLSNPLKIQMKYPQTHHTLPLHRTTSPSLLLTITLSNKDKTISTTQLQLEHIILPLREFTNLHTPNLITHLFTCPPKSPHHNNTIPLLPKSQKPCVASQKVQEMNHGVPLLVPLYPDNQIRKEDCRNSRSLEK